MTTNKKLQASIMIGGTVAPSLKNTFSTINSSITGVGKSVQKLESQQKLLTRGIHDLGKAGLNIDGLRTKYASVTTQLERARRAQDRYNTSLERAKNIGGFVRGVGLGVGAAVAAGGLVARPLIGAAINRENAVNIVNNTGETKENAAAMIKAAEGAKQFGVSTTEAVKTVGELRQALGTAHHAIEALPTALKAMSGLQLYNRSHSGSEVGDDAIRALAKIADERGATSAEAQKKQFDWAFRSITSSSNTVTAGDLLIAQRGAKAAGLAMDDKAFFGDTFLMQALSAPSYGKAVSTLNNALIGGHQDAHKFTNMLHDGLLNPKKVQLKNGLVTNYQPDALVDHELLIKDQQAWVEKNLIPLAKRKGVNMDDPAAVQALAARYFSNTNAANIMFMRMHNRIGIGRDRENAMNGRGVDESDAQNKRSTAGKEENIRARLEDAEARMGNVLLPAFASALEKTATALEAVNKFAEESPTAFKVATVAFVGLTAAVSGLAVVGGVSKLATAGLTSAMTLLGGSMDTTAAASARASTGLMGFLGKLGLVGVLSTAALAAAKAAGLPDVDAKQGAADVKAGNWWKATAHLNPLDLARAGAAHFQGKSNDEIAASITAGRNPNESRPLPVAPAPAPASRASAPVVTHTTTIQSGAIVVNALPGQSVEDIANSVIRKLHKQQAKQSRSVMFDGAGQ